MEAQSRTRLIVIGNGMAGCQAIEELLAREPQRFQETIVGAEPLVNYDRIMLSSVLAGVGREVLRARFLYSQAFSQDDPWAERAAGAAREQHHPIGILRPLPLVEGVQS
jgi:NADPH-dependent 2,4-dienoyl-CoA reductase/sulfur reductase-like enzyme